MQRQYRSPVLETSNKIEQKHSPRSAAWRQGAQEKRHPAKGGSLRCSLLVFSLLVLCELLTPGKAAANDLQSGDLLVGAANLPAYAGSIIGGGQIVLVRGGAVSTFCQSTNDNTSPDYWFVPQQVIADNQGRVVFAAAVAGGYGLLRCSGIGATPEKLAIFPTTPTFNASFPVPFPGETFGGPEGTISGLHLTILRAIVSDDHVNNGLPSLVTQDAYNMAVLGTNGWRTIRYLTATKLWEDGSTFERPAIYASNTSRLPDLINHSGATYSVNENVFRKVKDPLHISASGTAGGINFSLALSLFASANELVSITNHPIIEADTAIPRVPSGCPPPSNGASNDMPLIAGAFASLSGLTSVVYDEFGGYGLVVNDTNTPYMGNIVELLLDNPGDPTQYFQDSYIGCGTFEPAVTFTPVMPYYDPLTGYDNAVGRNWTQKPIASSINGLVGTQFFAGSVVSINGTNKVGIIATGLTAPSGIGAYPNGAKAGIGAVVMIRVDSPVNVLATDPNGKRIGVDSLGSPVNDFGSDGFDSGPAEPRFFAIKNPAPGNFSVQSVGTGSGPFTIHVYSADLSKANGQQIITSGLATVGSTANEDFLLASDGTLAFTSPVTQVVLTVTAADASRTYGAANPAFTGTITGIANGDNITATYATVATPGSSVGPYAIVPTLVDPGNKLANYTVTSKNGTLTVSPAPLTVTAGNTQRAYGDVNPAFTGTITGIQNGDNITATYATVATAASPVGTYWVVPTLVDPGSMLGNYTAFSNNGTLTVNAAALTVTAANASRKYGAGNPAFTGTITGIVNGDNITATYTSTATPGSAVGTYAIVPTLIDPSNRIGNYRLLSNNGALGVTSAPLTIAAGNASRPYGANNPALTGTILGIQNLDPISATYMPFATTSSAAGTYPIVPSAVGPANVLSNYTLSLVSGILTIVPETTSLTVTLSPLSIIVGQSTTATVTLTAPDMVIPIDPGVLATLTLSSPVVSDILTNNGVCTPVPSAAPGTASCIFSMTSVEPNGRTLNAVFAGSASLAASSAKADLIVTASLESQKSCLNSDFRNVAVPGGSFLWFNSIFKVKDVTKQKITISFFQSSVQFQYTDASNHVVSVNQAMPDAKIVIDPSVTIASTTFDAVNNVWITTVPFDLDDAAFLTGLPWLVPAGGIPADIEPVSWCGTFASDTAGVDIGWRWAAAAYSSFSSDNNVLGVKPMLTGHDNPGANRDLAGTPENFKQFVIPGARGKGGKNYTGTYSRSAVIE
jgi:MBG domain-containing protein